MSRGWDAVSRIGQGLMDQGSRKRALDEERKYAEEQANAQWEREAEKRKLEAEWQKERIEKEKALAERARVGTEADKLKAIAGTSVGPNRYYGQEATDESGRTVFIPQQERMGTSADAELRARTSQASTAARESATEVSRQDTIAERRRQEKLALQAEHRKLELAKTKELNAYDIRKHRMPAEEYQARVMSAYEEPIAAVTSQLQSIDEGLLGTANPPSYGSPEEAATSLRAADPTAIINIEGAAPKAKSKSSAPGSSKETAIRVSWEEVDSVPDGTWITLPNGKTGQK